MCTTYRDGHEHTAARRHTSICTKHRIFLTTMTFLHKLIHICMCIHTRNFKCKLSNSDLTTKGVRTPMTRLRTYLHTSTAHICTYICARTLMCKDTIVYTVITSVLERISRLQIFVFSYSHTRIPEYTSEYPYKLFNVIFITKSP